MVTNESHVYWYMYRCFQIKLINTPSTRWEDQNRRCRAGLWWKTQWHSVGELYCAPYLQSTLSDHKILRVSWHQQLQRGVEAAGWERDLKLLLSALVGNSCNVRRIQHIVSGSVSGRQEAVMMWAKRALVKIREKRPWRDSLEEKEIQKEAYWKN